MSGPSVLVVGAGGIGCPAAWGLVDTGVDRVTILDPDAVEESNLPRQVLFTPEDVGRPKALVAAERLRGRGVEVVGMDDRFDHKNAPALLGQHDVVLDATDGARTKDWINAACVRAGKPLVHAAGLRSEARLLDVPAGGRPCLACLFGRLGDEGGTCADLGVWPGVVGTIGFLAADACLHRLESPEEPSAGYLVLDLDAPRVSRLRVDPDALCPVCGVDARREAEPYPDAAVSCAPSAVAPAGVLDLVGEECPMNLLRARRAVEDLPAGGTIEILLGAEGAATVPEGLGALGHEVLHRETRGAGLLLRVRASGARGSRLDGALLRRFARQVVLPDVGEAGQTRWMGSTVLVVGGGLPARTAAAYLAAAGVGTLGLVGSDAADVDFAAERSVGRVEVPKNWSAFAASADVVALFEQGLLPLQFGHSLGAVARSRVLASEVAPHLVDAPALGTLVADAVLRRLLRPDAPLPRFAL